MPYEDREEFVKFPLTKEEIEKKREILNGI